MRRAVLLTLLALPVSDAAAAWRSPVDGPVARGFDVGPDPFEAGLHRGVDLIAPPGTPVRAPCGGPVVVAGRVGTSGRLVTLLCGRWRVTHMPLATIAVRRDATVSRGDVLGTVAASRAHAGLHLGVRREGTRFGYVDPLRFFGAPHPAPPVPIGRRGPRPRITRPPPPARGPVRAPAGVRPRAPVSEPAIPDSKPAERSSTPDVANAPAGSKSVHGGGLAPWPAWAGLALVLAGAGVRWRSTGRGRRAPRPTGLRSGPPEPLERPGRVH
jgi:hypothetical protein